MRIEFNGDELILTLVSLIRAVNPVMLRQGPDGFTVDFEPLEGKTAWSDDERLLLKIRVVLEAPPASNYGMDLSAAEGHRLAETLGQLESLQSWPADVLALSQRLRARLDSVTDPAS